jgi:CheY-like chemotaxis protein
MTKPTRNYSVFIADDDKDDQMFICSAFEELGINSVLKTFENGKLLLDYLTKNLSEQKNYGKPDFILLDLNMPVLDGMQTLKYMRKTEGLSKIPVVILSTSSRSKDVDMAFEQLANGYICKPLKCSEYFAVADALVKFWNGSPNVGNPNAIKFLRKDISSTHFQQAT